MSVRDLIPVIRRARGYRVYDNRRRYLDLWQDGGAAILGHRTRSVLEMKNQLSRGLLASYPTILESQCARALRELLPDFRSFRWFTSKHDAFDAIQSYIGNHVDPATVADPAVSGVASSAVGVAENLSAPASSAVRSGKSSGDARDVVVWRPFVICPGLRSRIALPILPLPGSGSLTIIAIDEVVDDTFYPSDTLSGVLLAGLKQAVYDLIRHIGDYDTSVWPRFDCSAFKRVGPYLRPACAESDYRAIYHDFLDHGIMLAPDFEIPSIIPGEFDAGEIRYIETYDEPKE